MTGRPYLIILNGPPSYYAALRLQINKKAYQASQRSILYCLQHNLYRITNSELCSKDVTRGVFLLHVWGTGQHSGIKWAACCKTCFMSVLIQYVMIYNRRGGTLRYKTSKCRKSILLFEFRNNYFFYLGSIFYGNLSIVKVLVNSTSID